jgi:drug/metabolite transporter (DMT)-like permease
MAENIDTNQNQSSNESRILDPSETSPKSSSNGEKENSKTPENLVKATFFLIICSICWALPPSLGKLMGFSMSPVFISWFRLLFAAILLFLLFLPNKNVMKDFKKLKTLSKKDWWIIFIGGVFEGVHYVAYFEAIKFTSALSISILVNVGEIFVAISGFIFFKERFTKKFAFAILLALVGILLIVTGGSFDQLGNIFNTSHAYGDFLIILSALLFSFYAVTKKHLIEKMGAVPLVVISFLIGSTILLPWAISDILIMNTFPASAWLYLILIALFGSALGYYSFAVGIKYTTMSKAGLITLASPIFAILFSVLLLPDEHLTGVFIIGSILIILSVFFISKE